MSDFLIELLEIVGTIGFTDVLTSGRVNFDTDVTVFFFITVTFGVTIVAFDAGFFTPFITVLSVDFVGNFTNFLAVTILEVGFVTDFTEDLIEDFFAPFTGTTDFTVLLGFCADFAEAFAAGLTTDFPLALTAGFDLGLGLADLAAAVPFFGVFPI